MTAGNVLPFVKGHGTENDFVLLPDPDGSLTLTEDVVRALCDRHAGIGGDGVIRVAPGGSGRWFMDYRNADGSLAEMCGNGARLFARFLVDEGWVPPGRFDFDTRGGVRTAELGAAGDVRVDMGPATVGGTSTVSVGPVGLTGRVVDVGNPHLVCRVADLAVLADLDLTLPVAVDPAAFPHGTNVEFVVPDDSAEGADEVTMRVHERGVGETRSCGTGTVAVAAAHLAERGEPTGRVVVHVPGGTVVVDVGERTAVLGGPAVVVARGEYLVGDPSGGVPATGG